VLGEVTERDVKGVDAFGRWVYMKYVHDTPTFLFANGRASNAAVGIFRPRFFSCS
jgi:hypothetical protein